MPEDRQVLGGCNGLNSVPPKFMSTQSLSCVVLLKLRSREPRRALDAGLVSLPQAHREARTAAATARAPRPGARRQEEAGRPAPGLCRQPALPEPWSRASSLQDCETVNVCCLKSPAVWSLSWQRQDTSTQRTSPLSLLERSAHSVTTCDSTAGLAGIMLSRSGSQNRQVSYDSTYV